MELCDAYHTSPICKVNNSTIWILLTLTLTFVVQVKLSGEIQYLNKFTQHDNKFDLFSKHFTASTLVRSIRHMHHGSGKFYLRRWNYVHSSSSWLDMETFDELIDVSRSLISGVRIVTLTTLFPSCRKSLFLWRNIYFP